MKIVFVYTGEEYLGIEYLSAVLKGKGHLTKLIYDPLLFNDYYISYKFLSRLFSFRKRIVKEILNSKADLIAFSVNTGEYNWAIQIASIIKNRIKTPIVFGGHHPTCLPEEVLKEDPVDFVIQGEGEYSLLELVESLEGKRKKETVSNLYYKQGSRIYKNELHQLIEDLDNLPFPDKELFYRIANYQSDNYTIMASRGCPYSCSYCHNYYLKKLYLGKGQYIRRRTVENVIEELKQAKKKYKAKSVMFQDEIFTLNPQWLEEFSKLYKKEINLPYACYVHPDTIDEKTAFLLRDSGCVSINMGIESIDERVREELLYRTVKQTQIINALKLLKKNHIYCRGYFVIGLPGQKEKDLIDLARFCNEYRFGSPMVFWLHYFPKTAITEIFQKKLNEKRAKYIKYGYGLRGDTFEVALSKIRFLIILTSFFSSKTIEYIIQRRIYRFFPTYHHFFYLGVLKVFKKIYSFFWGKNSEKMVLRIAFMPVGKKYKHSILKKIFMKTDGRRILKGKTTSICPECYKPISAKIVEETGNVLMEKQCQEHGKFTALVEEDVYFYLRLMNKDTKETQHTCLKFCPHCYIEESKEKKKITRRIKHYCCLMLPVNYTCNLNCNLCYFPQRYTDNPSFEELKKVILNFQGKKISLTGGEPTLREDLPQLIELITKTGKVTSLATNGLRLSDKNYTKSLKEAGLSSLVFSLNGFDDGAFLKIEGERLLDIKLKALDNLKKEKIKVQISVTLVKGVNEKELPKIYQYCLENLDFVTNLRIRSASAVGRCIGTLPLYGSEMLNLVSDIIGIDRKKLIDDFERKINYSPGFLFSIMLYLTKDKKMIDFDTNVRKDIYLPWIKKVIFYKKYFKARYIKGDFLKLWIDIISWPTKYNLDIEETKYSVLHHLTEDDRILPFNYALIENERYLNEDIAYISKAG